MWCGLLLLLALLPASEADTVSEFDRCVLGDCAPLTAAGGATVAPVGGGSDRTRDGASVAALKRSAEAAPVERDEGSGAAEFGGSAETDSPGTAGEEEPPRNTAAAAEEITTAAKGAETAAADSDGTTTPLPPGGTTLLPPVGESAAAESAAMEESEESEEEGGLDSGSGGSGGGPEEDGGEETAGPAGMDEMDWRTDHCSCDLTVSACDVDCCCDPDCRPQDRLAFSACQRRPSVTPDRRYCLQSDLIFSNNTEQRLQRVDGGLFCIVRDNMISRVSFPPVQPVTTSAEFDGLLSRSVRRHRYGWEEGLPPPPPPPSAAAAAAAARYRSGDLLWTVTDGGLQRWDVRWRGPVSAGLCDSVRSVRFLRPARTDCWLPAEPTQLAPLDAGGLFRGLCLLTSPAAAAADSLQELKGVQCGEVRETATDDFTELPPTQTVPIVPYLCDADHQNCTQVSEVPSPRVSAGRVQDALLSVLLVVEQRAGLVTAGRAELVLGAAPLGSSVRQQRAVQFRAPGAPPPRRRSGNPGYQRHRPLLAAAMVTNSSGEGPPRRRPAGAARPLLLPSPGRGGGCSADARRWRPLVFGVDAAVSCRMEAAAGDCAALQRRVMTTLLAGLPAGLADTALAAFGSAAPDGDWLPVLGGAPQLSPETTPAGCRGLVTAARWRVLFAMAGAAWRPQARLVGVRLSFGRPGAVWAAAGGGGRLVVTLQSTVTFQDVTRRPEPRFAQPPRVDISLPADFFYPFSAGGAAPAGRAGSAPALAGLLAAGLALHRAG